MSKQKGFISIEAVSIIVITVSIVGYTMNIVKLVVMDFEPLTTLLVVRIIGCIVPLLGAIVGYM